MRRLILTLIAISCVAVSAQAPAKPAEKPAATAEAVKPAPPAEVDQLKIVIAIQAIQLAQAPCQTKVDATNNDLSTLLQTLQREGFDLDISKRPFVYVPKVK